ncbi:unnamed protein product, partial [Brassica oleracea var. botrytis]
SSGLFGKKSASKSNPATPPHPAAGRSPPPSYLSNKRAETEYDFPISREQRTYPKQPASERVPNSHPRPPVYGYGTPERRERKERASYEPETNAPSSPFHPSGNRTPERRRKSSEYSREQQDRTYEADTRSNASPFHPFKSPSPSPYHTPDRRREHDADHYEAMYEPEANTMFQNRAPGSPFHQAGNRSPSPYRTPDRHSNEQFEDMYERDGDVTPRNSSPPSPFHPAANRSPPPQSYRTPDRRRSHPDDEQDGEVTPRTSSPPSPFHPAARRSPPPPQPYRTPDRRRNHPGNQQSEEVYERDGEVTPRNSSPPSPFHPAASRSPPPQPYRTPDRRSNNNHGDEQMEAMYEPDGYVIRQDSPPRSPVHGGAYYSSSDDDNHSTYLFPEIGTPTRSMPVSANTTPVHHNYQIVVAENYEPPELADESQSFSIQEIAKMRGLKEESQSMISESYVSVANYRVKASVAETLQAIISKHGDIAASSKLQSNVTRSYYLESLAAVVMELRRSGLKDLTKTRVAEMAAVVKDMESVKIEVSWLKKAVAELGEAVEYAGEYEAAKAEREACERDLKARKGEMEEMREELGKREKEIRECRERVTAVAGKLGQLEMKGSRLNKNLEMFHSKVDKFQGEAVLLHRERERSDMSGKVYHDCPNVGNPYHECNDRCFERINSGDVPKKEKKPFGFGKAPWRKDSPPISPVRVVAENRWPLPSYYAKRMVESDESPSFSSSDDTFNANLLSRPPSPLHGNKPESVINWLPMSPSLSVYCKKDSFASNFDHRALIHNGLDTEMTPRTRPKAPEHPLRTHQHMPRTPDSRPRTPERRSSTTDNSTALETRPRTPEHRSNINDNEPRTPEHARVSLGPRPKTAERRARSPEHRERSSRQRSKTPEPQGKYLEPRIPQTQPISHSTGLLKSSPETPETRPKAEEYRARNSRPGSRIPQTQQTSIIECKSLTGEETQSMMSESYVSVGSYKVRASVSDTLQQILDKHGDIASGSKLESLPTRSYFLETLASVVLQLQSTPLKQLKETRVLEMLAVVEDVESVRIRAGWLREALNEILEAARCYDRHDTTVVEKGMCEREALLGREEMEKILKEVRWKENEVKSFRQGLMETAGRLGDLEMKRARVEKRLAFLSSKVDKFDGESVLEKLF